jgi:hypothetical protein
LITLKSLSRSARRRPYFAQTDRRRDGNHRFAHFKTLEGAMAFLTANGAGVVRLRDANGFYNVVARVEVESAMPPDAQAWHQQSHLVDTTNNLFG